MAEFKPGLIVLSKVKGFSPWPSMILPESLAPDNIMKIKPKVRTRKSRRGEEDSEDGIYLVKFFSDDTYQWLQALELQPLPLDQLESFKPRRSSRKLDLAYKVAAKNLDMYEFATYGSLGSSGAEKEAQEVEESPVVEVSAPAKKKRKTVLKNITNEVIDVDEILSQPEEGPESQEVVKLQKQYLEYVDETFWGGLKNDGSVVRKEEAKKWEAVADSQSEFMLKNKRILIKEALNPAKDFTPLVVDRMCENILQFKGKIYLSSANKVHLLPVLMSLLKRGDLEDNEDWPEVRKKVVDVLNLIYPDCKDPGVQQDYKVEKVSLPLKK